MRWAIFESDFYHDLESQMNKWIEYFEKEGKEVVILFQTQGHYTNKMTERITVITICYKLI